MAKRRGSKGRRRRGVDDSGAPEDAAGEGDAGQDEGAEDTDNVTDHTADAVDETAEDQAGGVDDEHQDGSENDLADPEPPDIPDTELSEEEIPEDAPACAVVLFSDQERGAAAKSWLVDNGYEILAEIPTDNLGQNASRNLRKLKKRVNGKKTGPPRIVVCGPDPDLEDHEDGAHEVYLNPQVDVLVQAMRAWELDSRTTGVMGYTGIITLPETGQWFSTGLAHMLKSAGSDCHLAAVDAGDPDKFAASLEHVREGYSHYPETDTTSCVWTHPAWKNRLTDDSDDDASVGYVDQIAVMEEDEPEPVAVEEDSDGLLDLGDYADDEDGLPDYEAPDMDMAGVMDDGRSVDDLIDQAAQQESDGESGNDAAPVVMVMPEGMLSGEAAARVLERPGATVITPEMVAQVQSIAAASAQAAVADATESEAEPEPVAPTDDETEPVAAGEATIPDVGTPSEPDVSDPQDEELAGPDIPEEPDEPAATTDEDDEPGEDGGGVEAVATDLVDTTDTDDVARLFSDTGDESEPEEQPEVLDVVHQSPPEAAVDTGDDLREDDGDDRPMFVPTAETATVEPQPEPEEIGDESDEAVGPDTEDVLDVHDVQEPDLGEALDTTEDPAQEEETDTSTEDYEAEADSSAGPDPDLSAAVEALSLRIKSVETALDTRTAEILESIHGQGDHNAAAVGEKIAEALGPATTGVSSEDLAAAIEAAENKIVSRVAEIIVDAAPRADVHGDRLAARLDGIRGSIDALRREGPANGVLRTLGELLIAADGNNHGAVDPDLTPTAMMERINELAGAVSALSDRLSSRGD